MTEVQNGLSDQLLEETALVEKIGAAKFGEEAIQHSSEEHLGQLDRSAEEAQDCTAVTAVPEPTVGTA